MIMKLYPSIYRLDIYTTAIRNTSSLSIPSGGSVGSEPETLADIMVRNAQTIFLVFRSFTNKYGSSGKLHEYTKFFQGLLDTAAEEKAKDTPLVCRFCQKVPEIPYEFSCKHEYCCWKCYEDDESEELKCSDCGLQLQETPKAIPKAVFQYKSTPKPPKIHSWLGGDPSATAKTIAVKAQILQWLSQSPDAKILVFVQYIGMIDILLKMCNIEGWGAIKFIGEQSEVEKNQVLQIFKQVPTVKILVASLSAASVGLNIDCASRCIIVNPWWNSSQALQACYRIWRIGQTRECEMTILIGKGYIEEYAQRVQDKKDNKNNSLLSSAEPSELDRLRFFFNDIEFNEAQEIIRCLHSNEDAYSVQQHRKRLTIKDELSVKDEISIKDEQVE
jgi:SNF2 family DNA or RNA helicase